MRLVRSGLIVFGAGLLVASLGAARTQRAGQKAAQPVIEADDVDDVDTVDGRDPLRAAPPLAAAVAEQPLHCPYGAGAHARDTVELRPWAERSLPIKHVVVLMQENRSFDHYFGRLAEAGQPDADGIPPGFTNPQPDGHRLAPFHLSTTCVQSDPPHQWDSMHAHWNHGRMDGFVREAAQKRRRFDDDDDDVTGHGRFVLGYYDRHDVPFYYYLANTFTIADRYFSAAMAGTWPNRQFLYTGTAQTRHAPTAMLLGARSVFDALTTAGVSWAVYTDGPPRQDCIGWGKDTPGVKAADQLLAGLRSGNLPAVSFLDASSEDEHAPADIQRGERWARELYQTVTASPLWPDLVLFLTYDEAGGFFDHVPPPPACAPSADRRLYRRRGMRVPLLVISPWARRHHVSHVVHDHTSILRFIELLFDLPALSARDANADALLDAFDFDGPPVLEVAPPPPAGQGGCRRAPLMVAK